MRFSLTRQGRIKKYAVFTCLAFFTFLYYDYGSILLKRPQSSHQWRQCDGSSIAKMYANNGLNPLKPASHNLMSLEGRTVAEFPIIYYLDAVLITLFGHDDFVIRSVNLLIFYIGLLYLFKIGLLCFKNAFLALFPVIYFCSFPVVAFYASTSLPDIPALSLAFAGAYFLLIFSKHGCSRHLLMGVILISLSGMIKPTILYLYSALLVTAFVAKRIQPFQSITKRDISLLTMPFLLTFAWIFVAKKYNASYKSEVFLLGIKPIWDVSTTEVARILHRVKDQYLKDFFFIPVAFIVFAAFILSFIVHRHKEIAIKILSVSALFGAICYIMLFFTQFDEHDYYFLVVVPVFIILIFAGLKFIRSTQSSIIRTGLTGGFFCVLLLNLGYAREEIVSRYSIDNQYNSRNNVYFDITRKLRSAGISSSDRVVVISDISPNISLYLMDQRGWTQFLYWLKPHILEDYIQKQGAKYLIGFEIDVKRSIEFHPYLKELVVQHGEVQVFKLELISGRDGG
jgi:hypothetical protein